MKIWNPKNNTHEINHNIKFLRLASLDNKFLLKKGNNIFDNQNIIIEIIDILICNHRVFKPHDDWKSKFPLTNIGIKVNIHHIVQIL